MITIQKTKEFPKTTEETIHDSKSVKEAFLKSEDRLKKVLLKNAELEAESIAAALKNDLSL